MAASPSQTHLRHQARWSRGQRAETSVETDGLSQWRHEDGGSPPGSGLTIWQLPTQSLQGGTFTQYRAVQKSCEVLYIYIWYIYIWYMYVCNVCIYVWLCMNIDLGGALRKNGESQLPGTRSILRVAQLIAIYRTRRAPQPRQAAPCLSPAVAFPRHLLCSAIMPNWMTWPQTHSWWQKHEGVAWITWRVLFNTIK